MADLQFHHIETGASLYAVIERLSDNFIWDTTGAPAFKAYADKANWFNYDLPLAESPAGSCRYLLTFPAGITAAGDYIVKVFRCAGPGPAVGDPLVGQAVVLWTGSAVASPLNTGNVTVAQGGVSLADDALDADALAASALDAVAEAVGGADIDSTGQPVTLAKALEVILAVLAGKAAYDPAANQWAVKGRDGATTVATVTLAGGGNRPAVEIN